MAFQWVDGRSGPPRVQAIREYLVYREFKNGNKLTKRQSAFYYRLALAILKILPAGADGSYHSYLSLVHH